ncbi:Arginine N-succinyltransferase [hydrothermal vent metagenome]|uniref:Arginine N-succinyltransferase n=1 Tax=hydrothermal vent metagenome TaxID=652676 RepID=A0A3B1CZ28_9ZZZZ
MFIIRPVKEEDIDQVVALAAQAKAGLTTLPHDRKILMQRIEESVASFHKNVDKAQGELYFFVLEDLSNKKVLGTCAIVARIGGFDPFYTYEIKTTVKASKLLNVKKEIQYLQLLKQHSGPSEIGTLFLSPEARKSGNGRLLSLSRFLFMAQYPQRFQQEVIAELRGVLDEKGRSPFWNAVCKHFFEIDFKKADLMGMEDKTFIAELIPQHPIYIPLLPKEAQEVVGKVHKNTQPAEFFLLQEGFHFMNEVDIFEAGPVVGARLQEVRSISESREVVVGGIAESLEYGHDCLIANVQSFEGFRVVLGCLRIDEEKVVTVERSVAQKLNVVQGDKIRFVELRARS